MNFIKRLLKRLWVTIGMLLVAYPVVIWIIFKDVWCDGRWDSDKWHPFEGM